MPKQKNAAGKNPPKTKVAAIPRQAMRGVLRAREDGRQRVRKDSAEGGQYQEAAGLEERLIDDVASAGSSAAGTILRGSKRAVKRAAGQARQQAAQPEQETSAPQDRVAPGGTNGAAPSSPARQMQTEEKRTTIKRQQERRQEHHFKNTARKQPRTAPSPKTAQALRQQAARTDRVRKGAAQAVQRARRAAQVAQETAKRTAEIVRARIKALWVAAHTLAAALAAGGMAVVAVILVICMVAMVAGHNHIPSRIPYRPDYRRSQLPQRYRHRGARGHADPCGCRRHSDHRQRAGQLGRQLRLPRQAGPRRRADYSVRALLQHLCHGGPAGQSRAGHCLCGAYRPRNGTASAFRGAWVIGRAHAKKAMMANTMLPSVAAMTCSTLTLRCTSLAVGHRANHSCKRSPAAETSELHAAILPHWFGMSQPGSADNHMGNKQTKSKATMNIMSSRCFLFQNIRNRTFHRHPTSRSVTGIPVNASNSQATAASHNSWSGCSKPLPAINF